MLEKEKKCWFLQTEWNSHVCDKDLPIFFSHLLTTYYLLSPCSKLLIPYYFRPNTWPFLLGYLVIPYTIVRETPAQLSLIPACGWHSIVKCTLKPTCHACCWDKFPFHVCMLWARQQFILMAKREPLFSEPATNASPVGYFVNPFN